LDSGGNKSHRQDVSKASAEPVSAFIHHIGEFFVDSFLTNMVNFGSESCDSISMRHE